MSDDGEEVTAVVVLKKQFSLTLDDIKHFCRQHIAEYKMPTRLETVETLARTSVGKIDKQAIKKQFWLGRSRMIN
ncbi:hypothetical protein YSY43_36940 [Paenibacillus sp. YSY-4.3]